MFPKNDDYGVSATATAQGLFLEALDNHRFDAFFYGPSLFYEGFPLSVATFIFNNGSFANSVGEDGKRPAVLLSYVVSSLL